jgi:hypothetical protein
MSSLLRRLALAGLVAALLHPEAVSAANIFEAGAGWQDTGAIEGTLEWPLRIQGSRKDVPAYLGWRHLGETRIYWAPYARLNYTNFWSIGGAGNLLGVTVAPAGIGVYLSSPPEAFRPEERLGRWFATLELNFASIQVGGNVTPDAPTDPRIPDPNAYRATLRTEVQQTGGVQADSVITQRYPLGSYAFATLATPIQIRVWKMVTPREGFGFFVEGDPLRLEWSLGKGAGSPAYAYAVTAGFAAVFF